MKKPFQYKDIEDVRVIIKANGKNYSIIPNREIANDQEVLAVRKLALDVIMESHKVVAKPLEKLSQSS